jgi:hypothetical protein
MAWIFLICSAFHLYMLRWGERAYWRQVYIVLNSKS